MFDMVRIGKNIARLRKEAGLTQMGLADAMGISFQAVSNWRGGRRCPTYLKLPQLAAILGVSVDGLLGAEEAGMVERAMDAEKAPLSVGELADIAPLLPPEEARRNFERTREQTERAGGSIDLRQLEELAPFLDEEDLGRGAVRRGIGCELDEIARLAPFMAEEDVGRAVCRALELGADPGDLAALAPFMDEEDVGAAARAAMDGGGVPGDIAALAPFMAEEDLGALARTFIKRGGDPAELAAIAPFMDRGDLGDIVLSHVVNKSGGDSLAGLMPFIRGKRRGKSGERGRQKYRLRRI